MPGLKRRGAVGVTTLCACLATNVGQIARELEQVHLIHADDVNTCAVLLQRAIGHALVPSQYFGAELAGEGDDDGSEHDYAVEHMADAL